MSSDSGETTVVRTIGRYRVFGELGRGAMGVVYKGFDPLIGRTVALKTLSIDNTDAQAREFRERLYREAAAAGALSHPNIVTIFDIIEDGRPDGRRDGVHRGPAALRHHRPNAPRCRSTSRSRLLDQICAALDYAGSQGIVHRDIKPANILVTSAGRAKVTDFGVARLALSTMTQAGTVLGSPELHVAGAGEGALARRPVGPVLGRRRVLRDDHPRAAVRGQRHRHDDVPDRARGADAADPLQPGDRARRRGRPRARVRQEPRRSVSDRRRPRRRPEGGRLPRLHTRVLAGTRGPRDGTPAGASHRDADRRRARHGLRGPAGRPCGCRADSRHEHRVAPAGSGGHALAPIPGPASQAAVGGSPATSNVELPAIPLPPEPAACRRRSRPPRRSRRRARSRTASPPVAIAAVCWLARLPCSSSERAHRLSGPLGLPGWARPAAWRRAAGIAGVVVIAGPRCGHRGGGGRPARRSGSDVPARGRDRGVTGTPAARGRVPAEAGRRARCGDATR